MTIGEKHASYNRLKGAEHLEADQALLTQIRPHSKILRRLQTVDRVKLQQDILWELLDFVSEQKIIESRGIQPMDKLPKKELKTDKPKTTKGGKQDNGKGKGKGKASAQPAPEPEPEPEPEPAPEPEPEPEPESKSESAAPAEGEKKEEGADEGTGVSEDTVVPTGESGHTEGNHPV